MSLAINVVTESGYIVYSLLIDSNGYVYNPTDDAFVDPCETAFDYSTVSIENTETCIPGLYFGSVDFAIPGNYTIRSYYQVAFLPDPGFDVPIDSKEIYYDGINEVNNGVINNGLLLTQTAISAIITQIAQYGGLTQLQDAKLSAIYNKRVNNNKGSGGNQI